MVGVPCAEDVDAGTDMDNAHMGGGTCVVAVVVEMLGVGVSR